MRPNSETTGSPFAVPLELGDPDPTGTQGFGGTDAFTNPPRVSPTDIRATRDIHTNPHLQFYDPNSLQFADAQGPIVRGFGGYFSAGMGMVRYDHQPTWDRTIADLAGPVRAFFRRILFDNRTKHL